MKRQIPLVPLLFVLFLLVPLYWLVIASFKSQGEIMSTATLWPAEAQYDAYAYILANSDWYWGYINAAIYVLLNVFISLAIALPAAFAFSRFRFFGDRFLLFAFLAFRMTAPAILLVPFVQVFSELNLIDTYIGVALAHCVFNVPIAILILEGFVSSVPIEMDEVAKADGYSQPAFFFRILLPQIGPGIAVTAFFCFMFSWVEILLANGLTTIDVKPIGSIMTRVGSVFSAYLPIMAAASVLAVIPGLALLFFVRKHLARGFSLGMVR